MIKVAVDRRNRIVQILDTDQYINGFGFTYIDNDISDLNKHLNDYTIVDNHAVYRPNIALIRLFTKKRCSDSFNAYYNTMFYDLEQGNEITPYEFNLNTSIRTELINYVRDNQYATPVTDALAAGIGVNDYHDFRMKKYDEIMHHDMVLAALVAQKTNMFKVIDECDDPETLHSMEFNFSWPSYSNMRWRT